MKDTHKRAHGNLIETSTDNSLSLFPPSLPCSTSSSYSKLSNGTIFAVCSCIFTLHEYQNISVNCMCALLCVSFMQRYLHFFSKSYPLLFLFLCYPCFGTSLLHIVSSNITHYFMSPLLNSVTHCS